MLYQQKGKVKRTLKKPFTARAIIWPRIPLFLARQTFCRLWQHLEEQMLYRVCYAFFAAFVKKRCEKALFERNDDF
jgi:hypothetical protein